MYLNGVWSDQAEKKKCWLHLNNNHIQIVFKMLTNKNICSALNVMNDLVKCLATSSLLNFICMYNKRLSICLNIYSYYAYYILYVSLHIVGLNWSTLHIQPYLLLLNKTHYRSNCIWCIVCLCVCCVYNLNGIALKQFVDTHLLFAVQFKPNWTKTYVHIVHIKHIDARHILYVNAYNLQRFCKYWISHLDLFCLFVSLFIYLLSVRIYIWLLGHNRMLFAHSYYRIIFESFCFFF